MNKRTEYGGSSMGQSNAAVRQWMGNPKRFADLFNATVFDGEQVIREGMSAEDCLDGDLSSQIRTIWDDSYYSSLTGDYPVGALYTLQHYI